TAGFPGTTPEAAVKLFAELGITIVAAHTGLPMGNKKNEVLDTLAALGKPRMVCTQIGPADVENLETIKALCDRLNEGYEVANSNGISYSIHNHWWEFGKINGRLIHHYMLDLLNPGILLEVDTYWVKVAGPDPVEIVKNLGARAPLLHIKDGPGNKEAAMTAVGDGIMDIPAILKAAGTNAKWLIVELDRCDGDIMAAVNKSYDYLATL
ncbi:MAG: sugar phosphate isomerase/epimerase, partial [Anaerolineaceae bacterium]|nr:sugar phosphate isomerase/epimerase [Anaerolineaceae bacterium]